MQLSKEKKSVQDPDKEVTHVCEKVRDMNSMEEPETLRENQHKEPNINYAN